MSDIQALLTGIPESIVGTVIGTVIASLLVTGVGSFAYFAREMLVNRYIVPMVKKEFEKDRLLRDEITHGKFLVVSEEEFATNYPINSETMKQLKDGGFQKHSESIQKIESRVSNLGKQLKDAGDQMVQAGEQMMDTGEADKHQGRR